MANPIGAVDPALKSLGFARIKPSTRARLAAEISGDTKSGKTRLVMTMTPPIGLLNFDRAVEDILRMMPNVDVIVADLSKKLMDAKEGGATQNQARLLEAEFAKAHKALFEHRHIRSIGVDKGTTLWEVMRLAEWGRINNIKAHHYVPVNARMRAYLSMHQGYDKNVCWTHDTKEEWVDEKPTGRMLVDGFKYAPSLMQLNASMWRDKDGDRDFHLEVTGCAFDPDVVGMTFDNEDISWPNIASMAVPGTKKSDWR